MVLSYSMASLLIDLNRLVVALAKSQDHRAFCGVFAFGQPNAVRRWLVLRYPVTRASQSRERGRIPRARWLRIVWDSVLRWHGSVGQTSKAQSEPVFNYGKAVLCSNIHHGSVMRITREWLDEISDDKGLTKGQQQLLTKWCSELPYVGKEIPDQVAHFLSGCRGYREIPQYIKESNGLV